MRYMSCLSREQRLIQFLAYVRAFRGKPREPIRGRFSCNSPDSGSGFGNSGQDRFREGTSSAAKHSVSSLGVPVSDLQPRFEGSQRAASGWHRVPHPRIRRSASPRLRASGGRLGAIFFAQLDASLQDSALFRLKRCEIGAGSEELVEDGAVG